MILTMKTRHFAILVSLSVISACAPKEEAPHTQGSSKGAEDVTQPAQEAPSLNTVEEASIFAIETSTFAPEPAPSISEQSAQPESLNQRSFSLVCGPWKKYLRSAPKIYSISKLPSGIESLLKEEQKLIKAVIETDVDVSQTSDYSALQDRLAELKASIPSAETSTGYVKRSSYYRRSYATSSSVYINSYPTYYSYTVFREKEKSSSPELVRAVQGIATNATLEDLDQRVDALQYEITKWKRRTSQMSTNGTEGIMRDANEAYITGLEKFTKDFIHLRSEYNKIEQAQEAKKQEKAQILSNWSRFERNNLSMISEYLSESQTEEIELTNQFDCQLHEKQLKNKLLLACEIGPRTLYFELDGRHAQHPFILADVTPAKQ